MNALFTVLFTGARELPDPRIVGRALYNLAMHEVPDRPILVRHGACPGDTSADHAVTDWVKACGEWCGVTEDPTAADWDHCAAGCPRGHRRRKKPRDIHHPGLLPDYCPAAGPRRNAAMVAKMPRPDLCLAAPHGASPGTRGCMKLAAAAGIPVREVTW